MREYIQVTTTTGSREDAIKIARELVQGRMAACVQVGGPITSLYRWEGKIMEEREWCVTIKTCHDIYTRLEKTIKDIHPYKVPEIIAVPVMAGSREYLEWMDKEIIS